MSRFCNGLKTVRWEADEMTKDQAEKLADMIQDYWRARGYDVTVIAERMEYDPALRSVRYELRSNLVNGQPQRQARQNSKAA